MSRLHSILVSWPSIHRRAIGEVEQEIDDELAFHLEMRTEECLARGLSPADARAAAMARFGDLESVRRSCRKALLGDRIMIQRLQLAFIGILLLAVVVLAYQTYSTQRAMAGVIKEFTQLRGARGGAAADRSTPPVADWEADRPRVVGTSPAYGGTEVDSAITEIRVTFDKEMTGGSWSWVKSSAEAFPETAGDVHYMEDMKTCVMPVKLKPSTKYVIWFNTANYQNFKDREGRPAVPHLLTFTTGK